MSLSCKILFYVEPFCPSLYELTMLAFVEFPKLPCSFFVLRVETGRSFHQECSSLLASLLCATRPPFVSSEFPSKVMYCIHPSFTNQLSHPFTKILNRKKKVPNNKIKQNPSLDYIFSYCWITYPVVLSFKFLALPEWKGPGLILFIVTSLVLDTWEELSDYLLIEWNVIAINNKH
jgi:hypothetical protein